MTTLCAGDTYVYLGGSDVCMCGGSRWTPDLPEFSCTDNYHLFLGDSPVCVCGAQAASGWFGSYSPPNYQPNRSQPEAEIPAHRKALARQAGASHISADGCIAYKRLFGKIYQADWLQDAFGVWWVTDDEEMPNGAVNLEDV
jgi:hypothetical protein